MSADERDDLVPEEDRITTKDAVTSETTKTFADARLIPFDDIPPEEEADEEKKGVSGRVIRMFRPQRAPVVVVLVLGAIGVTMNVLGPMILGKATDLLFAGAISSTLPAGQTKTEVIEGLRLKGEHTLADVYSTIDLLPGQGIDFGAVGQMVLFALALYVFGAVILLAQGKLAAAVVQRVVFDLREEVAAKIARLPLTYFDAQSRGSLLSRVTNDVDTLQQTLTQTLSHLITALLTIVGVLAIMFLISPLLVAVLLVSMPLTIVVAGGISKRAQPRFADQSKAVGSLNAHIEEMYSGHSLVKGFGRREDAEATFDERNEELYQAGSGAQFLSGTISPAMGFLSNLQYIVAAVVGALLVTNGTLSVGNVQAFIQYTSQFSQPVTQAASIAGQLQSGIASAERIFDFLDAHEQEPDPISPAKIRNVKGRVEFQNVSFSYTPDKPLIENLDLTVEPGQTVAIVGGTGAGKSTLGNLLMRFYQLNGGRILLDGVDITTMGREDLRSKTGMVLQETWLFGGTIAENIAYGREGATREEVLEAARATHVDRFVRTLPDGYDTVLDDEGSGISSGEKQLITVARAFLAQPSILVLDEATSSVDTRTEVLIQRAMNSLQAGRTSFIIAHRLSTIREADLIVVMDSGKIIERGTHDELVRLEGGYYARLYTSQFAEAMA